MKIIYLLFIITIVELAAAVVALITYKKYRKSNEKFFLIFLWYTFFIDLIGAGMGHLFGLQNWWLYNAFMVTMFLFYFYWYNTILKSVLFKKIIRLFVIVFVVVAIGSFIFANWSAYHKYTFVTGAFFVLILTVFHFYELLNSNQVLIIKHKLSFWISTGLLLFSVGMIPLFSLSEYLNFKGSNFVLTVVSLNIILYGCYIVGFIWTKKNYNHF